MKTWHHAIDILPGSAETKYPGASTIAPKGAAAFLKTYRDEVDPMGSCHGGHGQGTECRCWLRLVSDTP